MLGLEQLSPEDRNVVARARRLERFLTQPFFTTEQFTGLKGKLVSLEDALDGCERILHDEFKDFPESALYMIGTIDEAKGEKPSSPHPCNRAEHLQRRHKAERSRPATARMNLKILPALPRSSPRKTGVLRIVAETREGSFGLLPHRLDCVAALAPGILVFETEAEGEVCLAVDEGVLVKTGTDVLVSVRNAIGGTDLGKLREAVEQEFLNLDEQEKSVRSVLAKLESGFIRRFAAFHHE